MASHILKVSILALSLFTFLLLIVVVDKFKTHEALSGHPEILARLDAFEAEAERLRQRYVCIVQVPQEQEWLDWCDHKSSDGYIFLLPNGSRAPMPSDGP